MRMIAQFPDLRSSPTAKKKKIVSSFQMQLIKIIFTRLLLVVKKGFGVGEGTEERRRKLIFASLPSDPVPDLSH